LKILSEVLKEKLYTYNVRTYKAVVCASGLTLSIQAGTGLYSSPDDNLGPYTSVELAACPTQDKIVARITQVLKGLSNANLNDSKRYGQLAKKCKKWSKKQAIRECQKHLLFDSDGVKQAPNKEQKDGYFSWCSSTSVLLMIIANGGIAHNVLPPLVVDDTICNNVKGNQIL
jgi:hypothetical protein